MLGCWGPAAAYRDAQPRTQGFRMPTGATPSHKVRFVPLRCLIVDDSPEFLDAARRLLQQEGVDVAGVASTGDRAIRLADELRPDATLVDIDLGGEDGIRLAQRLAEDPARSACKVILISTHDEEEFVEAIEASPAVGFIAKSDISADAIRTLIGPSAGRRG